jgi:RNA polymerase sigma-70 factor (ECF subfamily)
LQKGDFFVYLNNGLNRYTISERPFRKDSLVRDKILVTRCKKGNREALRRIYEKYRQYLLVLAVALSHDKNMAEDAVHDVFVGFAEKLAQFRLTGSLRAYLSVCVANRIRDLMRNKQNRAVSLEPDCTVASDSNGPAGSVVCNEELQQLSSALAKLPAEQREAITLRIYSRMRFGAIAESLGISVNTVKGRYRYGINKLRSMLNSEVEK